jgi:hypothetical protein
MQFTSCLRFEAFTGCYLTTLFGTAAEPIEMTAATPRKHGWLPLLTVLFLVSYALMTMLIVEQGKTIESQRGLIRELYRAGSELSAAKMKPAEEHAQAPAPQTPTSARPSTQAPVTQAPLKHNPSSQAAPQHRGQSQATRSKEEFQMPSRPESDLSDSRRSLITI